MPSAAVRALEPRADSLLDRLEQHRDFHFRRVRSRRIKGSGGALGFINEVGFCSAFSAGLGLPCLREALLGEREPRLPEHIQHDYAIGMVWRLKDDLAAKGSVYYGKALAGRPGFVSLEFLPAFLRLRRPAGGYIAMYRRGELGHCAKLVMDALSRGGPSETRALKLSSGYSAPSKRYEFDRAMAELQQNFLALKVEERYDPFTYVWDTVDHRWPGPVRASRKLSPQAAAVELLDRYLASAGFCSLRNASRILGIEPRLALAALSRLNRSGRLCSDVRIPMLAGRFYALATLAS